MKIAIGMPIQDNVPGETYGYHVSTIVEVVTKCGTGNVLNICPVGVCPHDAARQQIVDAAIKAKCDRIFFMDDDTITPPCGFITLMDTMDHEKAPAVTGFYARRGDPYTSVWSKQVGEDWYQVDADGGIHEIHMAGLGCCLLDLNWLLENVPAPWFQMKQSNGITNVTDDLVLFEAIRKAGGRILGNANVQCIHVGRREYVTRETAQGYRLASAALKKQINYFIGPKGQVQE